MSHKHLATCQTKKRTGLWTLATIGVVVCLVACGSFLGKPRQGWEASFGPVVPHDTFPADCSLCHTGDTWTVIRPDFTFDHEKETGVALNGAHKDAACLLCHNDRGKAGDFASRGCAGCHVDPHRAQLGGACADCHNETSWRPHDSVARHNLTRFPLVGAHAAAACFRCHAGAQVGNFVGADTACATCHQADLARATNPDHAAQGWTADCQRCHIPTSWSAARFNHPSSFPLAAGHAGHACADCHQGGVFTGLSTSCSSCHMPDYQATTNPSHPGAGFSTQCAQCHTTATWLGANFAHPASFPLSGGHGGRACAACHQGGVYTGLSTACSSCHLPDYQATTNPNHASLGYSTTCTQCHGTATWQGATFNHPATFPLTAGHGGRACADCHQGGVYTGLSTSCSSCHMPDYQATTNPSHVAAGFPTACQQCHTTSGWAGATFTHAFPITSGPHALSCTQCHLNAATFAEFSCTHCHAHTQSEMGNEHNGVSGYAWVSQACYQCHPQGRH